MNKTLKFSIDRMELLDEVNQSQFAKVKIFAFASGNNAHDRPVSEEALKRSANTIYSKPLVWIFDRYSNDIGSHDPKEVPCGFVHKEDNPIEFIRLDDGRLMLSVEAMIWKRYSGDILSLFERDGLEKPVSVEIQIIEEIKNEQGQMEIVDLVYLCITILGSFVKPAITSAKAEILAFSIAKQEYDNFLNFEIPSIVKLNSQKGLLLKQNNSKGATAVNVSIANQLTNNEFASLDLLHNIVKFSAKTKTETAQYLLGGFESLEWAESIINPQVEIKKEEVSVVVIEKFETEKIEQMGADANVEATAQAELADKQVETDKELTNENKQEMSEEGMAEVIVVVVPEEDTDDTEGNPTDDDFKVKFEEMCNKYSALETQMSEMTAKMSTSDEQMAVYMAENEQLRQFKANIETNQMMSTIEYTFSEVMESMPKEKIEELREDAKNFSIDNLNIWVNKVKAEAFSFSKGQSNNDGITRIGLPFVNENKNQSNSLWDKI